MSRHAELGPPTRPEGIWDGDRGPDVRAFRWVADPSSETDGLRSNRFLERAFESMLHVLDFQSRDGNTRHDLEDAQRRIPGREAPLHHTDESTLRRVGS